MVKPSSFKEVQDAIKALEPLLGLIPTGFETTPTEREDLSNALNNLIQVATKYPKRTRKRKEGEEDERRADWLDDQGVKLWNVAQMAARTIPDGQQQPPQDAIFLAHLKYAGYKLIDAATHSGAVGPDLVRLLSLATKAAAALLGANDIIKAETLIVTAADLEKKLLAAPEPIEGGELEERLSVLVAYYLTRCDVAIAQSNASVGFTMIDKAFNTCKGRDVGISNFKMIASKFWEVGNALRQQPDTLAEACNWLQQGLEVVKEAEKLDSGVSLQTIKIALLRTTARAELSRQPQGDNSLETAASALKGLTTISNTLDRRSVHEIKLLQLIVLQRQNAKESEIQSILLSLMDTLAWEEEQINEILAELLQLENYKDLQTFGRQTLLVKALEVSDGHPFITRVVLSILLAVRKQDQDFQTAMRVITQALDKISAAGVRLLDLAGALACQTVLWSFGETTFKQNQFNHAAQWYIVCAHKAFYPLGKENFAKCHRKAALAYIQDDNMSAAQAQLDLCPPTESATQYLSFLIAATENRPLAAIAAVEAILTCDDLEGKQLLLMAQVASDKGMETVLATCLHSMIGAIKRPHLADSIQIHSILFIRCLVKMTLAQIRTAEDANPLVETLVSYLYTAIEIIEEMKEDGEGEAQQSIKGIAWLYKNAYNAGIAGSATLKPSLVAKLFDATAQLMNVYQDFTTLDNDPELPLQRATAMFACLCGNLFDYHDMEDGDEKDTILSHLFNYIEEIKGVIEEIELDGPRGEKRAQIASTLCVMETELMCETGDWEALQNLLEDAMEEKKVTREVEAMITVLAKYPRCPTSLMVQLLERVLQLTTTTTPSDIVRLARWTRSLVSSLIHRGGKDDETKAQYFVDRARKVLASDFGRRAYPVQEQQWLVSTAWGRGTDIFGKGAFQMGQRWCLLAITLAEFIESASGERDAVSWPGEGRLTLQMMKHYEKMVRKTGIPIGGNRAPAPRAIME